MMPLNPDNTVIKLCVEGMQAEAEGRFVDARICFEQAWAERRTDLDACIAAHYQARHQDSLERILHWNLEALRYADAVTDALGSEQMTAFYPSLYLNLGKSYEDLGDPILARHYYQRAEEQVNLLAGKYGGIVRRGVAAGLQRTIQE